MTDLESAEPIVALHQTSSRRRPAEGEPEAAERLRWGRRPAQRGRPRLHAGGAGAVVRAAGKGCANG